MKTVINFDTNAPKWIIFIIDVIITLTALGFAYLLRFNFDIPEVEYEFFLNAFLVVLGVRVLSASVFKTYSGVIRHTSIQDLQRLFISVSVGTGAILFLNLVSYYLVNQNLMPFSVVIIEYILTFFLMAGFRSMIKLVFQEITSKSTETVDVAIYGAGRSGLTTKKALERVSNIKYNVVAYFDVNPSKIGKLLERVKIYDDSEVDEILRAKKPTTLIIAVQDISKARKAELIEMGLANNIAVKVIPPVEDWIGGELSAKQIKSVKIEELLGRKPIQLNQDKIEHQLSGKTVLVTGAAGSIGSGLVDQIIKYKPGKLIMVDQAESPLYELELRVTPKASPDVLEVIIADIRDFERMEGVFSQYQPDVVYHAAAYKHVPLMENNPVEAIRANVFGTRTIADLSDKYHADKFVMVSTDKAVNPTNVMGATKRISELYTQSKNAHSKTKFVTTRFGNVLGSNGSVIPIFRRQIENGGPITVTHPDITRFFMTIPEACQLVLEAGMMGQGGEIYIFDMGESVKIVDLAKKMIKLSGLTLGEDIEIKYSGLRPGEKLYEELLANEENTVKTHHSQIMIAKVRQGDYHKINYLISELVDLIPANDGFAIVGKMKELVPEFISKNSIYATLDKK